MLERLGSLSSARPRRTLVLLLLFVIVAGLIGGPVAGRLDAGDGFTPAAAESSRADAQLERATGRQTSAGIVLLVEGGGAGGGLAERTREASDALREVPGIVETAAVGRSRDGEDALVTGTITAAADEEEVAEAVVRRFDGDAQVVVGGSAVAGLQIGETVSEDLARAELIAFPLLVLLALLFFRGRAALLPLVVGVTTVLGTFLVLSGVNEVYGLSIFALNLVIGLGLGLAIDYTLFLLTRFREELGAGATTAQAIRTTMASAGRTVAFSAATVAVALATLTLFPLGFAQSMGIAGAVVALVAAVASLAVSPALLAIWGRRLLPKDDRRDERAYGRWHRLAHAVMRRPGAVAAVTAALMLLVALPAAGVRWTPVDASTVPSELSARVVSDAIERDFGGAGATPVTVAISASAAQAAPVAAFAEQVGALDGVRAVAPAADLGGGTWRVTAEVPGDPAGATARDVVEQVRALETPFPIAVTGPAAEFADQQASIGARLPIAVLVLCGLTFLVLWLMTGSVVLPAKAIVMNALTVGAALSPLLFIYQDGRLEGLLGFTSNGGVEPTNFLVTAALVFALSTDYGVFLLGRIKEARDGGESEREAVAVGLARTGRVVTAAAILLAVAIGVFSTSSIPFIQQIGIATAVGVLLDAFVVRTLLVPALMALLGSWNWWSPAPLRRLHARIGISEGPAAPAPAAPTAAATPAPAALAD